MHSKWRRAWRTILSSLCEVCGVSAGAITPLGRRRDIYGICRDFSILILEDDPYYYLQFSTAHGGEPKGLTDLGQSYLSMDTDGRVIRLDSFSKASPSLLPGPALPSLPCMMFACTPSCQERGKAEPCLANA